MKSSIRTRLAWLGIALAAMSGPALAEYPEKEVTITVGFGPGGGVDSITRAASDALSASLGKPIVVENQPGRRWRTGADRAQGQAGGRLQPGRGHLDHGFLRSAFLQRQLRH